jgi:hypothetical protein
MKVAISFEFECGAKTCAIRVGEFCRFFSNDLKGGGMCYLFGEVFDENGWIQRHPECLKQSKVLFQ